MITVIVWQGLLLIPLFALAAYCLPVGSSLKRIASPWLHASRHPDHWSQNVPTRMLRLFMSWVSASVPKREKVLFEEQFKYLIVTSPLLRDVPATLDSSAPIYAGQVFYRPSTFARYLRIGFVSSSVVVSLLWGLSSIVGYYFGKGTAPHYLKMVIGYTVEAIVCIMEYRYRKREYIREVHTMAVEYLQQIIVESHKSDTIIYRLIEKIGKTDIISQGITLAPPESSPRQRGIPTRSGQVIDLTKKMHTVLQPHLRKFIHFFELLKPLTIEKSVICLRDLYNIEEPVHILQTIDFIGPTSLTLDQLTNIGAAIRSGRRECALYLLALNMMVSGSKMTMNDYESSWRNVIDIMAELLDECQHFSRNLEQVLDQSYPDEDNQEQVVVGRKAMTPLHRLNVLENQLRDIQYKLLLCRLDTKDLLTGTDCSSSLKRISKRVGSLDQDVTHMATQWEETRKALIDVTTPDKAPVLTSPVSPTSSETVDNLQVRRQSLVGRLLSLS